MLIMSHCTKASWRTSLSASVMYIARKRPKAPLSAHNEEEKKLRKDIISCKDISKRVWEEGTKERFRCWTMYPWIFMRMTLQ